MKKRIEQLKQIFWSNLDLMARTTNTKDWQIAAEENRWIDYELKERCEKLIFSMFNKALK